MKPADIPKRFRRNEVANLCRRKGYQLVRFYSRFYKKWFYRTVGIERYWRHLEKDRRKLVGLEYCPTDSHTPLQRIWAHMQGKKNLRIVKP